MRSRDAGGAFRNEGERGLPLRRVEVPMRRLKPDLDERAPLSLQFFDTATWWQGVASRPSSGVTLIGCQRVCSRNKPGSLLWASCRSGKKLKVKILRKFAVRLFIVQDNDLEVG